MYKYHYLRLCNSSINIAFIVTNGKGFLQIQSGSFFTKGSSAAYGYPWSNLLDWGENGNLLAGMPHTTALLESQNG
jgi:hypothetical protein